MPHVTFAPLAILTIASAAMTAPTLAQTTVRNERVQVPRGATSTSVRGTIRGYQVVDYVVGARAGQALAVSLRTDNASTYFNVLPPARNRQSSQVPSQAIAFQAGSLPPATTGCASI